MKDTRRRWLLKRLQRYEAYDERETSMLLRLTPHDGLPKMVLEALACGRSVVWNHPFPHCTLARTDAEVEAALIEQGRRRSPQEEASLFVRSEYAPQRMITSLKTVLDSLR